MNPGTEMPLEFVAASNVAAAVRYLQSAEWTRRGRLLAHSYNGERVVLRFDHHTDTMSPAQLMDAVKNLAARHGDALPF